MVSPVERRSVKKLLNFDHDDEGGERDGHDARGLQVYVGTEDGDEVEGVEVPEADPLVVANEDTAAGRLLSALRVMRLAAMARVAEPDL